MKQSPPQEGKVQIQETSATQNEGTRLPGDSPGAKASVISLAALWLVIGTVLQLFRHEGVPPTDSIWAEDGVVFLADALEDPARSFFHSYTGYSHLVPRAIAAVTASFPLESAALLLAVGAALTVSLLSLYVYKASRTIFRIHWSAVVVAGMMVLLPAAGLETVNNVTNLRWYLLFGCFWAVLHRTQTPWEVVAASFVALGAALSEPLTALLLPIAGLRLWKAGKGRERLVAILFVAAVALQSLVVLTASLSGTGIPKVGTVNLADMPGLYGLRVTGSFLLGEQLLDNAWRALGWGVAIGSLVIVVVLATYGVWRIHGIRRALVAGSLAYSIVFYVIPILTRGSSIFVPMGDNIHNLIGSRYVVAPTLFLATMVLLVLEYRPLGFPVPIWRRLRYGLLLVLSTIILTNFSLESMRSAGPSWSRELLAAEQQCQARGAGRTDVSIAPTLPPGVWKFSIGCSMLDGNR